MPDETTEAAEVITEDSTELATLDARPEVTDTGEEIAEDTPVDIGIMPVVSEGLSTDVGIVVGKLVEIVSGTESAVVSADVRGRPELKVKLVGKTVGTEVRPSDEMTDDTAEFTTDTADERRFPVVAELDKVAVAIGRVSLA